MQKIRPVILCGGNGTRLWPLSRWHYPKQFMDVNASTLFGDTLERARQIPGFVDPIVVCNEEHRFYAAGIVQEMGLKAKIILEPQGRNTAPAIALAALESLKGGAEELLLVLPSDHKLEPVSALIAAVQAGSGLAREGRLGTFGLRPTSPETGYGYIEMGAGLGAGFKISRFVEKPNLEKAEAMLEQGNFLWNSGMFLFTAQAYLAELEKLEFEVYQACCQSFAGVAQDLDFLRPEQEAFLRAESISIDYAVMERTDKGFVMPLQANWNDLGSFEAFYETSAHDEWGNAQVGDVLAIDSSNCYLHSSKRLLATLGVKDLIVVETADAVLVTQRDKAQEVKLLLQLLLEAKRPEATTHARVFRPWGTYETISRSHRYQVKRIIVKPGGTLSLQLHHHRAEHWVVVAGTAKIQLDEKEFLLSEDESIYIPLGTKHRLDNPGCIDLELIEVQSGAYLGEDDIVRFADNYGRSGLVSDNQENKESIHE